MKVSKDELVNEIEMARKKLNESIEIENMYDEIYQSSIELDQLIALYIVSGY